MNRDSLEEEEASTKVAVRPSVVLAWAAIALALVSPVTSVIRGCLGGVLSLKQYEALWGPMERVIWTMPVVALAFGAVALLVILTQPRRAVPASIVVLAMVFVVVSFMSTPRIMHPGAARRVVCLANIKNLSVAVGMYVSEWGVFPSADHWCDAIAPEVPNRGMFACPVQKASDCSYGYNADLSMLPLERVSQPDLVVSIFESDAGWNAAGGPELLPKEARHMGGDNYGFADGHVEFFVRKRLADPKAAPEWEPAADEGQGTR